MKYILQILAIAISIHATQAQIQFRPLPEEGFEKRIQTFINDLEIVSTHDHLTAQENLTGTAALDFMLLLHHYADDDIKSAGMSKPQFAELLTDKYSVMEKWKIIKPYWEASKNTAYGRVVLLTIDELYGIKDLSDDTVLDLSEQIKKSYEDSDWYNYVLKKRAKIKFAIMDVGKTRMKDKMFVHVEKFDRFVRISSKEDLLAIGKDFQIDLHDINSFCSALDTAFRQALDRNIIGIKTALAYHRQINYENEPIEKARKIFKMIMESPSDKIFNFEEVKAFQDFMMHQIIRLARKHDLPIQIHTGLQAGDGNILSNSNPVLLSNLFLEYRDVKFVIFHGGYPYGGIAGSMAKNFRNVYLDMSWLYIISPSFSERFLHEWLETVPANKIMAFGADYHNVENAFGHSLIARKIVSKVLIEKVKTGYFTETEAINISKMILSDNAIKLFKID